MRRAILIALPHTMRVLGLHRRLRTGEPQRINGVEGGLIDASDGWVRMVDDHAAYDEADLLAELEVVVASDG